MLLNNYKLTSTHEIMRFAVLWILLLASLQPLLIDTDYSELSDDFRSLFQKIQELRLFQSLNRMTAIQLVKRCILVTLYVEQWICGMTSMIGTLCG